MWSQGRQLDLKPQSCFNGAPALTRQKITFGEMRGAGVRGLLIY
jgi:hypothetical protein